MSDSSSAPSKYLRYLPALYGAPQTLGPNPFVGQYLKIFEKLLSGIDDAAFLEARSQKGRVDSAVAERKGIREMLAADVIGTLFHPRLSFLFEASDRDFLPPISAAKDDAKAALLAKLGSYVGIAADLSVTPHTAPIEAWLNEFLDWLGSTIALSVEKGWTIDKKRNVIAQMLALYRLRGTVQGTQYLLDLWLDLPLDLSGAGRDAPPKRVLTVEVSNPALPPMMINDEHPPRSFRVSDCYRPGAPIVSSIVSQQLTGQSNRSGEPSSACSAYAPWLFEVDVKVSPGTGIFIVKDEKEVEKIFASCRAAKRLLDEVRPAATHYAIRVVPAVQLGYGAWSSSTAKQANNGLERRIMSIPNTTKRLSYQDGMFLTASNMTLEQDYFINRAVLLNKALYAEGVIDGLTLSLSSGNKAVSIDKGCAFDSDGNLLVFPGTTTALPVPGGAQDFCYVYLSLPARSAAQDDTVDDAAQVTLTASEPRSGLKLAKLRLVNGIIQTIGDSDLGPKTAIHIPFHSRRAEEHEAAAQAPGERSGSVRLEGKTLAEPGKPYPVSFDEANSPVFSAVPRVFATVALPFAVSVDDVRADGFTLQVTAVTALDVPPESVVVEWFAVL